VVGGQSSSSRVITHGVDVHSETYQTVGGAQRAQVMNVDLTDPNVRFGAVEAGDKLIDPADETISSMANRTGAVAGVNSDFFAINATGQPMGMLVQNGVLEASPVSSWPYDLEVLTNGQMKFATEQFTGTVDDTTTNSTRTLVALNRIDQTGLTAVTPYLGAVSIGASTIATATVSGGTLTITSVKTSQTLLPQLAAGQEDLIARRGTADSTWLQAVHVGDTVTLTDSLAPYGIDQIQTAVSGGAYLVQNGQMAVPAQGGGENNVAYPIVGVGVSKDGTHAIMAVFDGRASENTAVGLTRPQFAQWMLAHGAYNAIEFDSGGSAEMVGRLPGQQQVSVLNTPSDGAERPVANGLFVYTNETSPGPAATATVNNGKAMAMLPGSTDPLSAYATDAEGNPASDPVEVTVQPPKLATVSGTGSGTTVTAGSQPGRGYLTVQAGGATSQEPLTVAASPATLTMSPAQPDLNNNDTQQFSLSGTAAGAPAGDFQSGPLTINPQDATWSVSPSSLGTVSSSGLFTAAASGSGLATVSATADGVTATTTVAVGSSATVVDPMTDVSNWGFNTTNGATATLSESTSQTAQPGDTGSMDVSYSIPKASGVSQVVFYPSSTNVAIGTSADGEAPDAIGVWIKGIGGSGGTPLGKGVLTFAEQWIEINGQTETFYPTAVTYNGWQLIVAAIPAGTEFPLSIGFLDFLVINPSQTTSGDLYVADLEGLYSPRQPVTPTYTAIPDNPSWLQYTGSPADFGPGGATIADFDDSHLQSGDHNTTGSVVTNDISQAIQALPSNAAPNMLQVNGDLTDTGSIADTDYGYQVLQSFGLPFHDAVGNHEIGQGADPEDQNWSSLYGPTHYTYTDGNAEFIVTDSANGGLLASDPYQVPSEEQYQWLASQLTASTSKVIFLVTHMPAYDPHAVMNSQFADRYEAEMYEQLAATYQASHPQAHVILLFGHARGVAEQLLDPLGNPDPNGLPNFTVADAGVPAYATVDQGGFYNYALFHVLPDGDVQFAIQPVLTSIAVTAPASSLAVGSTEQLSATGTTPTGDDLSPLQVPIADPASHAWSSSDPKVADVDPSTGEVTADSDGTATISVLSGGVTGTVTITVTG
jgi:exopolysaccharide biosynthesis protein